MGSYASQTNELERWQITHHVMNLKRALNGEPLAQPIKDQAEPIAVMMDDTAEGTEGDAGTEEGETNQEEQH